MIKIIDESSYLKSIVGPASKLHITILIIEREPSDVNLTGGFEYSRRNVSTAALVRHNNVGWESSIKLLVSAEMHSFTQGGKNGFDQKCFFYRCPARASNGVNSFFFYNFVSHPRGKLFNFCVSK